MSTKYRIVGSRRVCGHEPGTTVDVDDLAAADVAHLISAGHIAPTRTAQTQSFTDDGETVEEQ